jgi:hypothetical protein
MRLPALGVATVFGAVVLLTPGLAQAKWTAAGSGTARVGATTIRNASGLASACVANPGPDDVQLTWAVSPDSAFVSYVITRTGTGGAPAGTINAAGNAITVNDLNNFTNANGYTLIYTIRAVVGTAPWTTTVSASTTRTFTKSGKCS